MSTKAENPYGDESALGDVFQHLVDVEELVEPDVGQEM
jgi:hypothetical protein